MKLTFNMVLLSGLLAIGAPLAAAPPDNFLEADGCDVMFYLQDLPSGGHTGAYLLESVFSGERYTYTYDQTDPLAVFAPDGLSARQVSYINWRIEELGAKGTNRTEVRLDLTLPVWTFDFDGEIIRGTRFATGGIGGTGTYDPATDVVTWTSINMVFCQGHR